MTGRDLEFGIYPLGVAGTPTGLATGPPDDDEQIGVALRQLGGSSGTLPARTYAVYAGPRSAGNVLDAIGRYRDRGILAHLVVGCMEESGFDLLGLAGIPGPRSWAATAPISGPSRSPTNRTWASWKARSRTSSTCSSTA